MTTRTAKTKPKAQAAIPTHARAVENQKRQIQAALKEAWGRREQIQRVEDTLREMVPGAAGLYGRPFWERVWANFRRDPDLQMQIPEFENLTPRQVDALLRDRGGPDRQPPAKPATAQDVATQPATDHFGTKEQRVNAITCAAKALGTRGKVAQDCGVDYSDLRKWARERGRAFAKGPSEKTGRIERRLLPYCPV